MFANRVEAVKPSATLALAAKVALMKSQAIDIISLGAGEPDFDTPQNIKDAAIRAINEGQTKYTPVNGAVALKAAIVSKFWRENGLRFTEDEIIVSTGAKQVIYNALMSIIEKGDEVILAAPYWVSYPDMILLAEGKPVVLNCGVKEHYKLTPEKLLSGITSKTKCIILNSPSNPTGVVYSKAELKRIAELLLKYPHIKIISDDIYEHIVFDNVKFVGILDVEPRLKDRVLVVNGVSKAYSMTGWRIGYGAGDANWIKKISTIQSQSTSGASSISQAAALEALSGDQGIISHGKRLFQERRDIVVQILGDVRGLQLFKPSGAFYFFINCEEVIGKSYKGKKLNNTRDFVELLLEEYRVAVVLGDAFGAVNHFRISFALSNENLMIACRRIAEFVGKLS